MACSLRGITALGLAALGAISSVAGALATERAPVIAAASDLKFALEEAATAFTQETGRTVRLAFGSSGDFFRQIEQGAPFELYLSADEAFVRKLWRSGKTDGEGMLYATGRLVIMAPHGSPLTADSALAGLKAALAEGRVKRFAIANPEHAPYGMRAEEALRHAGLWDKLKGKLVLGENIAQAAQFATTGAAQGGIIAYSLALAPEVSKRGRFALIPEDWHEPLGQRMVLLKGASETARAFYRFLGEPEARAIFRKYGFVLPGESA